MNAIKELINRLRSRHQGLRGQLWLEDRAETERLSRARKVIAKKEQMGESHLFHPSNRVKKLRSPMP